MQRIEDIESITKKLQEIYAQMREHDLPLEQSMKLVGEAVKAHAELKKDMAKDKFDVQTLRKEASSGKLICEPFDWKALA